MISMISREIEFITMKEKRMQKRREQECLKEELQKVHKECERLKMQIEAYENSKSWKATAPFRK